MDRHQRGRTAERLARELLVGHGLVPLDANWRCRVGEIDLILREPSDGTVVFVEVRYRSRTSRGGGLESVDAAKRARLRRAALAWLQRHGDPDAPARIDVVAIGPCPTGNGSDPEPSRDGGDGTRGTDEARRADRPDRRVTRRENQRIEWIVSAVEDGE